MQYIHSFIFLFISLFFDSYANELLGNPKEKESLWGVITNTRLLQLKWGRVDGKHFLSFSFFRKKSYYLC